MRDIKRIDGYMKRLSDLWKKYPDLRFGQLLMVLLGEVQLDLNKDLFFVEDEEFFTTFEKCFKEKLTAPIKNDII